MVEPHPPTTLPVPSDLATGDWSADTAHYPADGSEGFGIPNPFGRYAIQRLLGRGGMGRVFLARDTQLDRLVALKVPTFHGTLSASLKQRFFREARAIAALRHPNICPVHDVDEEKGTLYLTMAYIDGQTLAMLLRDGPIEQFKAAELIRRVAIGMQAAHEHGTIHRDLKPANIMIDPAGEPVVMDFGLARRDAELAEPAVQLPTTSEVGLTQMGSVLGTPAYMPPEQAVGDLTAIGPRSDVYSLGAVLYESLTGRRPFDGPDAAGVIQRILNFPPVAPRDIIGSIDVDLERVCLKAMAKRPEDRYGSMAEFAAAIKDVLDPEFVAAVPPPLPEPPRPRRRVKRGRRKVSRLVWVLVTLGSVMIVVGVMTYAVWVVVGKVQDTVKDVNNTIHGMSPAQQQSRVEWDVITAIWQPPPADAGVDVLFPPNLEVGYRRIAVDQDVIDEELGITLAGQRAIFTGPQGDIEVRAYRCPEAQARAIQANVQAFVQSVQEGRARAGGSRKRVIHSRNNAATRTVNYGFVDGNNQNEEWGIVWYGRGWLIHFKSGSQELMEFFPSKYLMEIGKLVQPPKQEPQKK